MAHGWKLFGVLTLAGVLATGLVAEEAGGSAGGTGSTGSPGHSPGGRGGERGRNERGRGGRPARPGRPGHGRPRHRPRGFHVFGFHGFGLTEKSEEMARLDVWSVPDVWAKAGGTGGAPGWTQGDPANPDCNPGSPGYPECVGSEDPAGGGAEPEPGVVSSDDTTEAPGGPQPAIAPEPPPGDDEPIEKKGRVLVGVLRLGTNHYLVGDFALKTEPTPVPAGTATGAEPRRRPRILGFEATLYSRPPMVMPMIGRPDGSPMPVPAPKKVGTIALAREEKAVGHGDPMEIVAGKAQIDGTGWRLVGNGRGRWAHRIVPAPRPGTEVPPVGPGPDDVMPMPAEVAPGGATGSTGGTSVNEGF